MNESATFVHFHGVDGSAFSRQEEYTQNTMPEWMKVLLKSFPNADDIAISIPTRPGHCANHIYKRKTEEGVSGPK